MRDDDTTGYWAERANIDNDAPVMPPRAGAFDAVAYRDRLLAAELPEEKAARMKRIDAIWENFEAWARTQRKDYKS